MRFDNIFDFVDFERLASLETYKKLRIKIKRYQLKQNQCRVLCFCAQMLDGPVLKRSCAHRKPRAKRWESAAAIQDSTQPDVLAY